MIEYSFVIPVFNEAENLAILNREIIKTMNRIEKHCEIIWIDDGSTDQSLPLIKSFSIRFAHSRFISFSKNCGQSSALAAGFTAARGNFVITLDSDLQNNPCDILEMIPYLDQYDMVTGWRQKRNDSRVKKFSSRFANGVRNRLSRETVKDTGCSLKIMRRSLLQRIKMYQGMHRFLPTLMKMEGARVIEVPVNHRPRINGKSNYGTWDRALSGLRDLLAVRWMQDRKISYRISETGDGH